MSKSDQNLPNKEVSTFKTVLKLYDLKQYKKAIKSSDLILKKYPLNGETLCMKGLCKYQLLVSQSTSSESDKEEAFDLVKSGLRNNIKSYVCWHVFGIIQRCKGLYNEAVKAYQNALRYQPDNVQILRDTSLLQFYLNDYKGLIKTRQQLLSLQGSLKSNWIGFIMAHYLSKNYHMSLAILDSYLTTLLSGSKGKQNKIKNGTDEESRRGERVSEEYMKSELLIFKLNIYINLNELDKSLTYLNQIQGDEVKDKESLNKLENKILFKMGKVEEFKNNCLNKLLLKNINNFNYHYLYFLSLILSQPVNENREVWKRECEKEIKQREERIKEIDIGLNEEENEDSCFVEEEEKEIKLMILFTYLNKDNQMKILSFYKELINIYKKNTLLQSILLRLYSLVQSEKESEKESEFYVFSLDVIKRGLKKGIPSLFNYFKLFYSIVTYNDISNKKEEGEAYIVYDLYNIKVVKQSEIVTKFYTKSLLTSHSQRALSCLKRIMKELTTTSADNEAIETKEERGEKVMRNIWLEYFIIQDLYYSKEVDLCLERLNQLINKIPTLVTLYLFKYKIFNNKQEYTKAKEVLQTLRELDLQDRYINTITTKALIKAQQVNHYFNHNLHGECGENGKREKYGEEVISLFSRFEGDENLNLFEMQCIWYLNEISISSFLIFISSLFTYNSSEVERERVKKYLIYSLKYNKEIINIYKIYEQDQIDFHSYSLRRSSLNYYYYFIKYLSNIKNKKQLLKVIQRQLNLLYFILFTKENEENEENEKLLLLSDEYDEKEKLEKELETVKGEERKNIKNKIFEVKRKIKNKEKQFEKEEKEVYNEIDKKYLSNKKNKKRRQIKKDQDKYGFNYYKNQLKDTQKLKSVISELISMISQDACKDGEQARTIERDLIMMKYHLIEKKPLLALRYLYRILVVHDYVTRDSKFDSLKRTERKVDLRVLEMMTMMKNLVKKGECQVFLFNGEKAKIQVDLGEVNKEIIDKVLSKFEDTIKKVTFSPSSVGNEVERVFKFVYAARINLRQGKLKSSDIVKESRKLMESLTTSKSSFILLMGVIEIIGKQERKELGQLSQYCQNKFTNASNFRYFT